MSSLFVALFALVTSSFRTRVALQEEILALRHQLAVFQKNAPRRLRLQRSDRLLWVLLSRWRPGRPNVPAEIRGLIRNMSHANPLWGAPRIHGELLKLGIAVAQSTVSKYLRRHRKSPMQTWRTFLTNHTTSLPFRPQHSGFCLSSPCCRRLDAAWCTSV